VCAKGLGVVEAVPSHEVSLSERVLVRDAFQLRLKGSRINRGISRLPSCGRPGHAGIKGHQAGTATDSGPRAICRALRLSAVANRASGRSVKRENQRRRLGVPVAQGDLGSGPRLGSESGAAPAANSEAGPLCPRPLETVASRFGPR
jgi:hypothetical protein